MEEFSEKSEDLMNTEGGDVDDVDSEQISETFMCCICLDLLYKPVVLACGHMSCFWCVHESMDSLKKSCCPMCRNHYYHFPSICETLHLLLLKMYPSEYKRRENQTLEEEKEMECFSPLINFPASDASLPCSSESGASLNPCHTSAKLVGREEDVKAGNANQNSSSETCKQVSVSVDDVMCGHCKQVLFRPTVLNCGHAFCSCCIARQTNEMIKCGVCQSPHPSGSPKVCLEFDHFLEEQFPNEYRQRRDTLQMEQEKPSSTTASTSSSKIGSQSSHFSSNVHIGVGCDSCGVYPITGDRYRCKDCVEIIGYDLCKDCYTCRSKLPGRFNQKHTSDHEFEIIKPSEPSVQPHRILGLLRSQYQEISAISLALRSSSENAVTALPDNTNEDFDNILDDENVVDAPLPSSDTDANWTENMRNMRNMRSA